MLLQELFSLEMSDILCVVSYLKNIGSASDIAINATQPPMVSMIVFFTS